MASLAEKRMDDAEETPFLHDFNQSRNIFNRAFVDAGAL